MQSLILAIEKKNVVLLTGRAGSKSVTGKNTYPVLGRPLGTYAMLAAKEARKIDEIYISTDCEKLKILANKMNIKIINRPKDISEDTSELIEAIEHAFQQLAFKTRFLVTMHCNCGIHSPGLVDECISKLEKYPEADSCVTGYVDRSVHPYRTRRVTKEGYLEQWINTPKNTSSNRQNLDPCFILDGAVRVIRVEDNLPKAGLEPFSYLGKKILFVENSSSGDVHSLRDIRLTELILSEMGWSKE